MALLNNWDLKDENSSVYQNGKPEQIYMVSDLGATFGRDGLYWPHSKAKGNLKSYGHSKFIRRSNATTVNFYVPARPQLLYLVHPIDFLEHLSVRWVGRNIPRSDARWIGGLLSHFSAGQIRDAFRAGGYSPEEVEAFSSIVQERIAQLGEL
jgi:hypothetical protein